ncbi:unnamed protein product [Larinioides sclopetarius]|uniref:Uncharacterized protein n=1 Tax=Larinioides sclopetarius TaxID=280406 RepID=A0AAV2BC37_9ARAC
MKNFNLKNTDEVRGWLNHSCPCFTPPTFQKGAKSVEWAQGRFDEYNTIGKVAEIAVFSYIAAATFCSSTFSVVTDNRILVNRVFYIFKTNQDIQNQNSLMLTFKHFYIKLINFTKLRRAIPRNASNSLYRKTVIQNQLELVEDEFKRLSDCPKDNCIFHNAQIPKLSAPPQSWKPFIANRTSEILDRIPRSRWRYVPTKENPADIGSRGVSPKNLTDCRLWWEGPHFLSSSEADWPKQPVLKDSDEHIIKEKKKSAFVLNAVLKNYLIDSLIEKYSPFTKLIDVLAFCIRFINNCKGGKVDEHSTGVNLVI